MTIPSFQIDTPTTAILKSKTARDEKHGAEETPALTLGLRLRVPNTWLDMLSPGLCALFYAKDKRVAQASLEGTEIITLTKLRSTAIGALEVHNAYTNCTLGIVFGFDTNAPTLFGGCKVDKFVVAEMMDGGTVDIDLRVGTSDINAETAGRLVMMTAGSKHSITLNVPEQEDEKPAKAVNVEPEGDTPIEALAKADAATQKASKAAKPPKITSKNNEDGTSTVTIAYLKKRRTMAQKIARAERERLRKLQNDRPGLEN